MTQWDKSDERFWDGSEPGWVVLQHDEDRAEVSIGFGAQGPSVAEVKALRALVPAFTKLPAAEVFRNLKGKNEVALGDFEDREARRLLEAGKSLGLNVREEGYHLTRYSIINEQTSMFMLIDDEEYNQTLAREMIRRGVPVRYSIA